jgi:Leucine-rich repeat (LRR) protein
MKKTGYFLVFSILILTSFQQEGQQDHVDIPDNNFLNAIIEGGFDTDGDSIISTAEAEKISSLSIGDLGISDLTGIEAFVNLRMLVCPDNELTSLDITNCPQLRVVRCNNNQLQNLDVSNNTAITMLNCNGNGLTNLDVSNNLYLRSLCCNGNQLASLDISANKSIYTLSINEMPSLNQVCVWTNPFPPENVKVDMEGSPNVNFTTNCSK